MFRLVHVSSGFFLTYSSGWYRRKPRQYVRFSFTWRELYRLRTWLEVVQFKKKKDFYWDVGAVSSTLPLLWVFCTFNMNPTFALFDFLKNQIVTKFQHLGLFLWVGNELTQVVSHFAQMVVIKNMALSQSRHSELTEQCQAQHLNKLPWHCSHPCRIFNEQDDEWF